MKIGIANDTQERNGSLGLHADILGILQTFFQEKKTTQLSSCFTPDFPAVGRRVMFILGNCGDRGLSWNQGSLQNRTLCYLGTQFIGYEAAGSMQALREADIQASNRKRFEGLPF